uniref:Membrane anchored junction protein n=1 Tax=Jaculus jaculus TaxID=51337 RepID=A0A8C5LIM4_JACJA
MVLKPFTYPFPETRFFHIGLNVYKFKLRYGNSIRGEETENKEDIIRELEKKKEEAQQGNQEIPTSETTDVQEKDSKQGHSLLEPVVPLPEKSKSPPPKKLGTSGFFGFLSTLFPFRYFYSKSSQ